MSRFLVTFDLFDVRSSPGETRTPQFRQRLAVVSQVSVRLVVAEYPSERRSLKGAAVDGPADQSRTFLLGVTKRNLSRLKLNALSFPRRRGLRKVPLVSSIQGGFHRRRFISDCHLRRRRSSRIWGNEALLSVRSAKRRSLSSLLSCCKSKALKHECRSGLRQTSSPPDA